MLLDGRAQESGILRRTEDATVLLVYNSRYDIVNFTFPAVPTAARPCLTALKIYTATRMPSSRRNRDWVSLFCAPVDVVLLAGDVRWLLIASAFTRHILSALR
jgi:hypothetical protein